MPDIARAMHLPNPQRDEASRHGLRRGWLSFGRCIPALLALLSASPAKAAEEPAAPVARADVVSGPTMIERDGVARAAGSGADIQRGDRIETGGRARFAIVFADGVRVTLGQLTIVRIAELALERARAVGGLVIELDRGVIRLDKQPSRHGSARRVEISAGAATISSPTISSPVAAFDILVMKSAGVVSLVLLSGRAEVRNMAGVVELDRTRQGIDLLEEATAPGVPVRWPRERIQHVLTWLGQ